MLAVSGPEHTEVAAPTNRPAEPAVSRLGVCRLLDLSRILCCAKLARTLPWILSPAPPKPSSALHALHCIGSCALRSRCGCAFTGWSSTTARHHAGRRRGPWFGDPCALDPRPGRGRGAARGAPHAVELREVLRVPLCQGSASTVPPRGGGQCAFVGRVANQPNINNQLTLPTW